MKYNNGRGDMDPDFWSIKIDNLFSFRNHSCPGELCLDYLLVGLNM